MKNLIQKLFQNLFNRKPKISMIEPESFDIDILSALLGEDKKQEIRIAYLTGNKKKQIQLHKEAKKVTQLNIWDTA
jgi:hypothetical protein